MYLHSTRYRSTPSPIWLAPVFHVGSRYLRAATKWWQAFSEERRRARGTLQDFRTMSTRELHDIGLTRSDVPPIGWDAWIDIRNRI
jgi:uncharacterized protein YjiS (DUF1127 family)